MRQDLFHIPHMIGDWPFLGFGLLLGIWAAVAGLYLTFKFLRDGWNDELQVGLLYSGVIAAVIAWGLPMIAEARGIPVRGYGLMMLIAVTSSVALAIYRARQVGLADDVIYSLAMWMILPGIIGARIFFVIEYRERFFAPGLSLGESLVKAISLQEGGLVVFGSLIGAVLGLLAFTRVYRLPLLPLIDVSVPSMALGQAIGRIGCFFNGCCFGGECDLPWQVTFPPESPPYHQQLEKGKLHLEGLAWQPLKEEKLLLIENVHPGSTAEKLGFARGQRVVQLRLLTSAGDEVQRLPHTGQNGVQYSLAADMGSLLNQTQPGMQLEATVSEKLEPLRWSVPALPERSLPIHPTQIYSAIDAFILCGFLWSWIPFRRRHGELLALTLILHSISRFLLEIIRIDESSVFGTPWSISQNISIGMFVIGAAILAWIYFGPQREQMRVLRV